MLARDGQPVWDLRARTVLRHLRTRGAVIESLTLPVGVGVGPADDGVTAAGLVDDMVLIPGLWEPIPGYGRLVDCVCSAVGGRAIVDNDPLGVDAGVVLPFAYDWRLSNRHTAERLGNEIVHALDRLRRLGLATTGGVAIIAHSMGGLVARYLCDVVAGAPDVSLLVTLGTPHRGALKALDVMANGVPVLFGRTKHCLDAFVRSLPSVYELLPEYACIETQGDRPDHFEPSLCGVNERMAAEGSAFHGALDGSRSGVDAQVWWTGMFQNTNLTAIYRPGGGIEVSESYGRKPLDAAGDGTVPFFAAIPKAERVADVRRRGIAQGHGRLIEDETVLAEIAMLLSDPTFRGEPDVEHLSVSVDPIVRPAEPVEVRVGTAERFASIMVTVTDDRGRSAPVPSAGESGRFKASVRGLVEGVYVLRVDVPSTLGGLPPPAPVVRPLVVYEDGPGP